MGIFNKLFGINEAKETPTNPYLEATMKYIGGQTASYDYNSKTYLEKGYQINPDVYAVMQQMADKTKSVPYYVKEIEDQKSFKKLQTLQAATNGNYSIKQLADKILLQTKAFGEETEMDFPMDRPNPLQTWSEIFALMKIYLKSNGNIFWYQISVEDGPNKGKPQLVYILPSHLMDIVLKEDANLLFDENPIDYYVLREGEKRIKFYAKDIIHIKYPNPFFDLSGSHLFGFSPMRTLLRNLESSNDALDGNVKTMKNSGVFGFVTAKEANQAFSADQATAWKQNLLQMDNNPGRLSKLSAGSVPIEFTRLSLTTDELKVFDFLKYDQKQICNVLGWSDLLLNNDTGGQYDRLKEMKKWVITNNIMPDLLLIDEALTFGFIRKFKGYEKAVLEHDATELEEMQEDFAELVSWLSQAWWLKPNEKRLVLKYETDETEGMDAVWIPSGYTRIDEVGVTLEELNKSYERLQ